MSERGYDLVVIGFGGVASESPRSALCRIIGVDDTAAERLTHALPCAVLEDIPYARAEGLAASLQLAGAEVRIAARASPKAQALSERPRATLPEIGPAWLQLRDRGLLALAERAAPATLRPAASFEASVEPRPPVSSAASVAVLAPVRLEASVAVRAPAPHAQPVPAARVAAVAADPPSPVADDMALWATVVDLAQSRERAALPSPSPWLSVEIDAPHLVIQALPGLVAAAPANANAEVKATADAMQLESPLDTLDALYGPPFPGAAVPELPAPWSIEGARISLGFPSAFVPAAKLTSPQRPSTQPGTAPKAQRSTGLPNGPSPAPSLDFVAPAMRPVRASGIDDAQARRLWGKTQKPASGNGKVATGRFEAVGDSAGGLPTRTVWLLGALWLSVALLLWANDLLF